MTKPQNNISNPAAYGAHCAKTSACPKSIPNWYAATKANSSKAAAISTELSPAANPICTILPMKSKSAICPPRPPCFPLSKVRLLQKPNHTSAHRAYGSSCPLPADITVWKRHRFMTAGTTFTPPQMPHSTTCNTYTDYSATGRLHFPPTTGGKAMSDAPSTAHGRKVSNRPTKTCVCPMKRVTTSPNSLPYATLSPTPNPSASASAI